MKMKAIFNCFMALAVFLTCGLHPAMAQEDKKFKVLVVMSYDENYPWVQEIKEGIDSELEKLCEVRYFYMDTKKNFAGGEQKSKEAYALYQEFQPDGVIVADDDAQKMFVIPYLKDKVKTPVMFCGVNADPEKYGYPASNVSGILERYHTSESIALLKELVPSVEKIGFMGKDSPIAIADLNQIRKESDTYPAKSVAFKLPKTLKEAIAMTEEIKPLCDALLVFTFEGLPDENGKPLTDKEVMKVLSKVFGKPFIAPSKFQIKNGCLSSVLHTGQDQGRTSAKMLLQAMQGTPVSQIPITRNHNGKRMINVTVLKALGIKPKPEIIGSAELVRTEE